MNRLASETSPYLLQHKDNPVDWYPWGPEALERARAEDRPILLSVGYSACHWCHVMEKESFEDPYTAAMMNEWFVNIKVDREERPDVDSIYMSAVQQMTGRGGWPMTVFLTPDGAPFYGGTYFPPEPKHGLPSFRQVLEAIAQTYRTRREEVDRSAAQLRDVLRHNAELRTQPEGPDSAVLDRAAGAIASQFDARHGGFGAAPKFPQPMMLEFLLRTWARTGDADALRMVEETLRKMASGGIYDQVGGGFHRYSVDARWLVPHFEKMLYDNALLSRIYLLAHQATGDPFYRRVTEEVLAYVRREMRAPGGGFYSAQDADSEGEEGKFYVWTPAEVDAILGPGDGPLFRRYFDVTDTGNWEGRSILHVSGPIEEFALDAGVPLDRMRELIERGREALYRARAERVWPGRDEKVITAWNAMMLRSFAEAAFALDSEEYRETAVANAEFLLSELRAPDGRLLRTWRDGTAKIDAFLEDYALLTDALVSLYTATGNPRWPSEAQALADVMLERFWDDERGIFFDAAATADPLVIRPRDLFDNATPSGNSAAVTALLRLSSLLGETRYANVAERALEGLGRMLEQAPTAFGQLLIAADLQLAAPREVAVVGPRDDPATAALVGVLRERYLPSVTVAVHDPAEPFDPGDLIPLLRDRGPVDGRPAAYVCERFACRRPVTTPEELRAELEGG